MVILPSPTIALIWFKSPNLAKNVESLFLIYFRSVDKSSAHLEIVFIKCINKGVGKPWFKQWCKIRLGSNAGLNRNPRTRLVSGKIFSFHHSTKIHGRRFLPTD